MYVYLRSHKGPSTTPATCQADNDTEKADGWPEILCACARGCGYDFLPLGEGWQWGIPGRRVPPTPFPTGENSPSRPHEQQRGQYLPIPISIGE